MATHVSLPEARVGHLLGREEEGRREKQREKEKDVISEKTGEGERMGETG